MTLELKPAGSFPATCVPWPGDVPGVPPAGSEEEYPLRWIVPQTYEASDWTATVTADEEGNLHVSGDAPLSSRVLVVYPHFIFGMNPHTYYEGVGWYAVLQQAYGGDTSLSTYAPNGYIAVPNTLLALNCPPYVKVPAHTVTMFNLRGEPYEQPVAETKDGNTMDGTVPGILQLIEGVEVPEATTRDTEYGWTWLSIAPGGAAYHPETLTPHNTAPSAGGKYWNGKGYSAWAILEEASANVMVSLPVELYASEFEFDPSVGYKAIITPGSKKTVLGIDPFDPAFLAAAQKRVHDFGKWWPRRGVFQSDGHAKLRLQITYTKGSESHSYFMGHANLRNANVTFVLASNMPTAAPAWLTTSDSCQIVLGFASGYPVYRDGNYVGRVGDVSAPPFLMGGVGTVTSGLLSLPSGGVSDFFDEASSTDVDLMGSDVTRWPPLEEVTPGTPGTPGSPAVCIRVPEYSPPPPPTIVSNPAIAAGAPTSLPPGVFVTPLESSIWGSAFLIHNSTDGTTQIFRR